MPTFLLCLHYQTLGRRSVVLTRGQRLNNIPTFFKKQLFQKKKKGKEKRKEEKKEEKKKEKRKEGKEGKKRKLEGLTKE